jgi:hypothetical protein
VPSIEKMARHAATFVDALGIKKLDALGLPTLPTNGSRNEIEALRRGDRDISVWFELERKASRRFVEELLASASIYTGNRTLVAQRCAQHGGPKSDGSTALSSVVKIDHLYRCSHLFRLCRFV